MHSKNVNLEEKRQIVNKALKENLGHASLFESLNPLIYLGKTDDDIRLILSCIEK